MIYCFDSRLPWDYSKKEMAISKMSGNGILYDNVLKNFMDFEGNIFNIKDKIIFPRTGGAHIYDMNEEIIQQGGIPVVTNEQVKTIEDWPNYYFDERQSRILKGSDLIDFNTIKQLEKFYGKELFIKTKLKNFSGIISIDVLLDKECAFYKTLLHHLDDDFIISKKVDILEDEYGKKEYRCFVVNNEVYNISRFTTSVLHTVDYKILEKAKEIIEKLKDVFPSFYVLDLFEYQLNDKTYIDVVEFNPIHASGPYLYNSCLKKSDDLLHSNLKKVSYEFIDKIEECKIEGRVFNNRSNLYDILGGFSSNLRSICLTGDIGVKWVHDFTVSETDFARHDALYNFSKALKMEDDLLPKREEPDLFKDLLDSGLSNEEANKLKKLLKKNKI